MRNNQALFYRFPMSFIQLFLSFTIIFICIEFPVEGIANTFYNIMLLAYWAALNMD